MPNSKARRAHRHIALTTGFVFIVGLHAALLPSPAQAADPTPAVQPSGPPQQITVTFSEQDNFIDRLRRQGVADGEARAIDKVIRVTLSAAQRKVGALIEISFGGGSWPLTLQSLTIDPVQGTTLSLARAAVLPQATPTAQAAAATAPTPAANGAHAPSAATVTPVAVQPAKPVPPTDSALRLPKPEFGTSTVVAPAKGATDPEWPTQPPAPASTPKPGSQSLAVVRGSIGHDVPHSLQSAGVPARIAGDIAQAVNQHAPLRNAALAGGRFNVAYEKLSDPTTGFVMAEFSVNGTHQRIWGYRPEGGAPGFYTDDGMRIGGLAMQSPVPGAAIVSPYGMRKHPVLRVNKMHWGVDYEANTGTPILAAADGTIEDVRRLGNYGLYIRVSHSEGVETTYGHLSRFETGMVAGTPVKAGQVIGYAGRSGLASGPHLYFEVFVDGKRVNPEPMVSNEKLRLDGVDLAAFENLKQQATATQAAQRQ
jgi:murein DD-endopeptidase MepM/ murein hydrolase activator NlpD